MTTITPERYFEMRRALFDAAINVTEGYYYTHVESDNTAAQAIKIGHLAGLAWLAHEAGEASEREKKL